MHLAPGYVILGVAIQWAGRCTRSLLPIQHDHVSSPTCVTVTGLVASLPLPPSNMCHSNELLLNAMRRQLGSACAETLSAVLSVTDALLQDNKWQTDTHVTTAHVKQALPHAKNVEHCIMLLGKHVCVMLLGKHACVTLLIKHACVTPFFLPSSFVSLSYFFLAVLMRKCVGKHLCMSSTFPTAILNGLLFSDSATTSEHFVFGT